MKRLLRDFTNTRPGATGELGAARWAVLHGAALELLRALPRGSIDLIFADPPYFLSNGGTTCRSGQRAPVDKGPWDRSSGTAADHHYHRAWLAAARAALSPCGTIWVSATRHALFSVGYAMQGLGYHVLNLVTWAKTNAAPNLGCRTFAESAELLIWAAPARREPLEHVFDYETMKAENGGKQMRDVWTFPVAPARERFEERHSAQKPEALLGRIIRASSAPGAVVLDPFCGSGTTGVVAMRLGRSFVGFELDKIWAGRGARRIAAVKQVAEVLP